jgi:hypothetical protein
VTEPPAGTPSTVTGGPIVITTFDKPQGTNSGLNFTAASQQDITVLSGKIDVLNGKTDTVIANTNQIIANGNGLLTWTINQLTILDRAGYGGHNLSIAAPQGTYLSRCLTTIYRTRSTYSIATQTYSGSERLSIRALIMALTSSRELR